MDRFKNFVEEKHKKYIAIEYDGDSQIILREWCEENGFSLNKAYNGSIIHDSVFDFHTTIIYSETKHHKPFVGIEDIPKSKVKITGFHLLGKNNDIPVFSVHSEDIKKLRQYYEEQGLKDKWPDFRPHISLSYDEKLPELENIKLPNFTLTYDKIIVKDVD